MLNDVYLDDNDNPYVRVVLTREDGTVLEVYYTGEVTVFSPDGHEIRTVDLLTM